MDCGRKNLKCQCFRTKGYPYPSIHRGKVVAKIDPFLGRGNVYCTYGGARLEGSGEVALIAGAINSNPPQPASTVSFLPEQERYPPEELHLLIPQRVSFSTQTAPPNDIDFFDMLSRRETPCGFLSVNQQKAAGKTCGFLFALITERPLPSPRWLRRQRAREWPSRTGSCGSARCRPSSNRS